jgi:ribosomal protein S13
MQRNDMPPPADLGMGLDSSFLASETSEDARAAMARDLVEVAALRNLKARLHQHQTGLRGSRTRSTERT